MNRLKLLIASSIVVFLPGCALWDAYFMAKYDTTEYALLNKITTMSEMVVNECNNGDKSYANFKTMYATAIELRNFSQYIPRNVDTNKLATNIVELTKQGKEMYEKDTKVTETFCKLKLGQINRSAKMAQEVIGGKPR